MKPGFALSLSFEGITLSHRATDGWRLVGEVSLETSDLAADLRDLRAKALEIEPDGVTCKIIVPNDQIRYLTISSGSFEGETRREMARAALEGATPYDVADLVFDLSPEGEQTHIAAVARETLNEAEAFAREHAFDPVSFVAVPGDTPYLGEPFFGPVTTANGEVSVERDVSPVSIVGPAAPPTKPEKSEQPPEIPDETPENRAEAPEEPASNAGVGFASRRRKPESTSAAPTLPGASREAAPPLPDFEEEAEPAPAPESDDADPLEVETAAQEDIDPEPLTVSVTAPTLDIPEAPAEIEPEQVQEGGAAASAFATAGRFLSRRKSRTPKPEAKPVAPPVATAPPPPQDFGPKDETSRMTVFGARQAQPVGGKPRHLGLVLTLGLLIFLAAVAAWAAIFLEDGVAGLFGKPGDETEIAGLTEPQAPEALITAPEAPNSPETGEQPVTPMAPETLESQSTETPSAVTAPDTPDLPDEQNEALSETDNAVLEALRDQPEATTDQSADATDQKTSVELLQVSPIKPETPAIVPLQDLYEVSIDRTDLAQDAIALPSPSSLETDQPPSSVTSPAAAGTSFTLDERGLVQPSPEGTPNPDGVIVYLGKPPVLPPPTPTRFETQPDADTQVDLLAERRPKLRPDNLLELNERARFGGRTRAELGSVRPKLRPKTAKQQIEVDDTPTAQAVVVSRKPSARPRGFSSTVQKAQRKKSGPSEQVASAVVVAPRTVTPKIPSSASVARQATMDNAINLRQINLIGVYGTPSNRRALVRLPSGRYKKVKVGDNVDGGRVLAIGDSELRYKKGGRNMTLKIPRG